MFAGLSMNRFVSAIKNSMQGVVNWIPLRIHVHSRNTQPHFRNRNTETVILPIFGKPVWAVRNVVIFSQGTLQRNNYIFILGLTHGFLEYAKKRYKLFWARGEWFGLIWAEFEKLHLLRRMF